MEKVSIPYKVHILVETYEGDWTSEQIAAGLAGLPRIEQQASWFEDTPNGPQEITDEDRLRTLENSIKGE